MSSLMIAFSEGVSFNFLFILQNRTYSVKMTMAAEGKCRDVKELRCQLSKRVCFLCSLLYQNIPIGDHIFPLIGHDKAVQPQGVFSVERDGAGIQGYNDDRRYRARVICHRHRCLELVTEGEDLNPLDIIDSCQADLKGQAVVAQYRIGIDRIHRVDQAGKERRNSPVILIHIFPVDFPCSARLREARRLSKRLTLKLKLGLILSAREEEQEGNNHVERASKGHWFFNLFSSAEYSADVSVLIDVHPVSNSVYSVVRNMVQGGPMERVDGHLSELHPFAVNRFK